MSDIPIIGNLEEDSPEELMKKIGDFMDPGDQRNLFRNRAYDGQMHTTMGERGKTEVKGITMRDIRDCYIKACYESSGLPEEEWPRTVFGLDFNVMDPIAVAQNLTCNIEKMMGIFPNVPEAKTE